MADPNKPDRPGYDWLYSGVGQPRPEGHDPDGYDEATARIDRPGAGPPEPTTPPPRGESATPPSFGGTYAAPPRRKSSPSASPPPAEPPRGPRQPSGPTGPPSAPKTKQRPPSRPGSRRRWIVRGIIALILAWVLFLALVPIWAVNTISRVDAEPNGDRPADTSGTTYLLVGSDSREGLSRQQKGDLGTGSAAGQRTDTILMLHIPDGGGPNLLLSIPRDSFVDIPGHGQNKINAAYAIGGPQLLVQTVEQDTGIRIDNYIEIGFAGFVDIVDAVGGITVCPKTAVNDPKAGHLRMKKGCQEVDGHTALSYSRSRAFPLGDITRTEHQREVISEVGSKAASWSTVLLPWRYFSVWKSGAESLRVGENVGVIDLAKFGWAMKGSGSAKRCVVPFSTLSAQTSAGSSVLWDQAKAKALFAKIRADDTSGLVCNNGGRR